MVCALQDVEQANGYYQEGRYDAAIQQHPYDVAVVAVFVFFW